jgi:hypothetical protein
MESSEDEKKEIVRKMAQFSISTNKINEIQEKNLKMYPFICFNGVKAVEIVYDLTNNSKVDYDTDPKTLEIVYKFNNTPNNFRVEYHLKIDESQDNSNLDFRLDYLEKCVHNLFWKGIPVLVFFNGILTLKSNKTNVGQ